MCLCLKELATECAARLCTPTCTLAFAYLTFKGEESVLKQRSKPRTQLVDILSRPDALALVLSPSGLRLLKFSSPSIHSNEHARRVAIFHIDLQSTGRHMERASPCIPRTRIRTTDKGLQDNCPFSHRTLHLATVPTKAFESS